MTEEKTKPFLRKLFLPAAIIVSLLILLRIFVPVYIENGLCGKLEKMLKVETVRCKVRSFGFAHLDISDLKVGDSKAPFLTVDYARLDYPLLGLLERKVSVSGLAFRAEYGSNGLSIPGLSPEDPKPEDEGNGKKSKGIPDIITSMSVKSSSVRIMFDGRQHIIPFEFKANLLSSGKRAENKPGYDVNLTLYPQSEAFSIGGGFDCRLKKASCNFRGSNISLSRFQDFTDKVKGLKFSATADIEAAFDYPEGKPSLKIRLSDMDVSYGALRAVNSEESTGKQIPLLLQFRQRKDVIPFSFNTFRIVSPFPADISMNPEGGRLRISQGGALNVGAEIKVKVDKDRFNAAQKGSSMRLAETESLTIRLDADADRDFSWRFKLDADPGVNEVFELVDGAQSLRLKPSVFTVSGKGEKDSAYLNYGFKLSECAWGIKGKTAVSIPAVDVSGDASFKSPQLSCLNKLHTGKIEAGPLNVESLDVSLPVRMPFLVENRFPEKDEDGFLRTGMMTLEDGTLLGSLDLKLRQEDLSWKIRGALKTAVENLVMDFSGKAGLEDERGFVYDLNFAVPESSAKIAVDVEKINPNFSGISLDGILKLKGSCGNPDGAMKAVAEIGISGANIRMPESKVAVEGLDFLVSFKDLIALKSEPKQSVKFKKFTAGTMLLEDGEIEFQIESPTKYFVEKSGFSWCRGHVYSPAMRIIPGEDLEFILFCDRLNFVELLKQLQAADGTGEGTVNGRIPVKIRKKRLRIADGFLYTSPGKGGNIRLGHSQVLDNTTEIQRQAIDIAIAIAALKDFDYDWAKVSLNSENRNLLVTLDINGRPAKPLNFGFDTSVGLYQTEEDSGYKAVFQGILFTIKFTLPINRMLRYGNEFNQIMKNKASDQ